MLLTETEIYQFTIGLLSIFVTFIIAF